MSASHEPLVICWSGGKDSALALHALQAAGVEVAALLTTVTADYDRISMHGVRRDLLETQAAALDLPLSVVTISAGADNEQYCARMGAAFDNWRARGIREIAFGDLFLADLKQWREEFLARHGLACRFPLWQRDTRELAAEFIDLGFRAVTTCIDPRHLEHSFAGREYDRQFLADLPATVDPCGENGEFHTFVFDGPNFARPVSLARGEVVERDGFVFCDWASAAPVFSAARPVC